MNRIGYEPISAEVQLHTEPWNLARSFLGHYDLRIYLRPEAFIDVGRGSLSSALFIEEISNLFKGSLGQIGQFTETANCSILAFGNHRNDNPVNVTFGETAIYRMLLANGLLENHLERPTPICIGNNVIISHRAIVLPGIRIADGCVIGAGAVVTRDTEPFGIYGGSPARLIRKRPNAEAIQQTRWWDWSIPYLVSNLDRVQALAIDHAAQHDYREVRPRFVINYSAKKIEVVGAVRGDTFIPLSDCGERVRRYIEQIAQPTTRREWLADVWRDAE